jgi:hypothetical protein
MNALGPPKKAPGAGEQTERKLIAFIYYATLTLFSNIFGAAFWFVEQRRWGVADWLDNEDLQQ